MKILLLSFICLFSIEIFAKPSVVVGSKTFTESYILAEIISQVIEDTGEVEVQRKFGMGATGIMYQALLNQSVDLYPEYSGTIAEELLKTPEVRELSQIDQALASKGFTISSSLGFNDTYALAVRKDFADAHHLTTLSDLVNTPQIRVAMTHEFMERQDGYKGLVAAYHLNFENIKNLSHSLAYEALAKNEADLMEVYSTDAKIESLGLKILRDDRNYFPNYQAVILAQSSLKSKYPKTWAALNSLAGKINEEKMQKLNAEADLEKKGFTEIAEGFLGKASSTKNSGLTSYIAKLTFQHLQLVMIAMLIGIFLGLPLGIIATEYRLMGSAILLVSGLLQTLPSLALLCFLIPVFGIGMLPAIVALTLYSLLPIVVNTFTGLKGIDPKLTDSAIALGLTRWQRLIRIELPLATPSILAGIRTATITCIGTATLAALIGAGGYGVPIVTGLALNDNATILKGAIPAAVMALFFSGFLSFIERRITQRLK